MRYREIINEGRDAYLFHGTALVYAIDILATNRIDAASQYDHNPTGVSLTRDYLLARDFGTYWERQFPVVFVLDQQKLVRSRMKILPRQDSYPKGEIVPKGTQGKHIEQMGKHTVNNEPVYRGREAEEMVLSEISPLSDYLVSINVSPQHLNKAITDPEYFQWMTEEGHTEHSKRKFYAAIRALSRHPLLNRWVPRVQWSKGAEQIPEAVIEESLDGVLPWEWSKTSHGMNRMASFSERANRVQVYFEQYKPGAVGLLFAVNGNSTEVTGWGGSRAIFATILDIIKAFVKVYPDAAFLVGAKASQTSRVKLYRGLMRRLAQPLGYICKEIPPSEGSEIPVINWRLSK